MNGSSFFKEIGRSFIVSSLLPASTFLIIGGIIFRGFLPNSLVEVLIGKNTTLLGIAIAGMIALWLAFLLYSGQDSVYKLFEGYYYWSKYKSVLVKFQIYQFRKKNNLINEYLELEDEYGSKDEGIRELFPKARGEMQELELRMPLDVDNILPTKFGNVLRASEEYSQSRYGINSLTLWPRMVKFLPKELMDELEEINNNLVFMMNSSFLSYVLTLASTFVLAIYFLCWVDFHPYECICNSVEWSSGITYIPSWLFITIAIISRIAGWLFYRMGTNVAIEYGLYVRTAFDLYRHAFLEHMADTSPENIEDAKEAWNNIGHFYIFGRKFGSRKFQIKQPKKTAPPQHSSLSLLLIAGLLISFTCRILSIRKQRRARIT